MQHRSISKRNKNDKVHKSKCKKIRKIQERLRNIPEDTNNNDRSRFRRVINKKLCKIMRSRRNKKNNLE